MRNLKKILALALALVMSMSLVSIASATDFSDDADIEYQEAVEVLTALEVIDGVGNNTFNPDGTVTRAQMAKMITIISLGNVDPSAFLGTTTDLKDINGHWAEAYIKYCYSQGIIAGKGAGRFDPNANVTTAEAAKMLLVAIGYNSDVQGYEGAQWAINVTRDAQLSKFFDELSLTSNQALTRQEAAQMIYNAVQAALIIKTSTVDRNDGTISDHYNPDPSKSLLTETFEVKTSEGLMKEFTYDSVKGEWNYDVTVTDGDALDSKGLPATEDYTDLFRMNVKALWTKNRSGDVVVYGIYAEDSTVMAEGVLDDLDDADLANNRIKVGSTTYRTTNTTVDYYAFNATSKNTIADGTDFNKTGNVLAADSYSMKLIDNTGDGRADEVVYLPYSVGKVGYVGTNTITTNAAGYTSLKLEDIVVYSGIAKDDYVVIIDAANSVTEQDELTKAEIVSGKVTKVSGSSSMIGDTYYKVLDGVTATLGSEYNGVVVNGYLVGTEVTKSDISVNDYAVVIAAENSASGVNSKPQARLLLANGETVVVDVEGTNNSSLKGSLVTYEIDDGVYTLTLSGVETDEGKTDYCGFEYAKNSGISYAYKSAQGYGTINGNVISDDAVIFYQKTGGTYSVITGAELKKATTASITSVSRAYGSVDSSTGMTTIEMAYVIGNMASESDTAYAYLMADAVQVKDSDNNNVYELAVWTTDGKITLTTKNGTAANTAAASLKKGAAFSYKLTDELVSDITAATVSAVTAYNGTAITFAGGTPNPSDGKVTTGTAVNSYINDDTVILYVDRANWEGIADGEPMLAIETSTSGTYYANAAYILSATADADGVKPVKLLVVEIGNNWYNAPID